MAFDVKAYMEQLAQTAGLAEDDKAVLLKIAQNEKAAKAFGDDVLRQADYSRNMDLVRSDAQKNSTYREELAAWQKDQQKIYEDALAGVVKPVVTTQTVAPDFTALEKKWEEKFTQQGNQMIGLLETVGELASGHAVEFKEKLDTASLKKIAMEKNLSLKQAYEEMVAPRRNEHVASQRKAELDAAREEGARDFASKHKIPVDTTIREYHPIFDRDLKKQVGADEYKPNSGELSPAATRQLRDNFVESWNAVPAGKTSGT